MQEILVIEKGFNSQVGRSAAREEIFGHTDTNKVVNEFLIDRKSID